MSIDTSTPVLCLGGRENTLSVVRNLARYGVRVSVSGPPNCLGMYSRHCHRSVPVPEDVAPLRFWEDTLLRGHEFEGHIVFACNDEAIEFVCKHRDELAQRYILDDFDPQMHLAMLDKQKTLEMARSVGVGVPEFWKVKTEADLEEALGHVRFPAMVKPLHSHHFARIFGRKLFIVEDGVEELRARVRQAWEAGQEVMIVEMIPGPDNLLCSYYTYIDKDGEYLYHFTKRIVRRYPTNRGGATSHRTDDVPEVAEASRRFLAGIGFRGIGQVEFKRDPRDGILKVIENNTRFVAGHELVVRSGLSIDWVLYRYLTGQRMPLQTKFNPRLGMVSPPRDFLAFLQLRRRGELSFLGWLRSLMALPQVFPVFWMSDPMPFLMSGRGLLGRIRRSQGHQQETPSHAASG
ncbi:carboxylate--amine ligase [Afifella pfennigii]|uniref:carboxylate--amine ligase n=1 Tax=Afifella pfennigii TaxID=209897 RepID=UPI000691056D|nr:hypothetical protein [Afifella pfennigii]